MFKNTATPPAEPKGKKHYGVFELNSENGTETLLRSFSPDFNQGHNGKLPAHKDNKVAAETLVKNLTKQHKEAIASKNASQNRRKGDEKNPLIEPFLSYEVRPVAAPDEEQEQLGDDE